MSTLYFYRGYKIEKETEPSQTSSWKVHFPFCSETDETEYTDYYVSFSNLDHARKYIDEQYRIGNENIHLESWPEPVENF